ncbi:MAG: biotin/lipoyl-binding protein, partial [Chitinophagaceae bacterium]|nr:biotin/lipoyl-binding protein [Chitinophagaceae bacterium]
MRKLFLFGIVVAGLFACSSEKEKVTTHRPTRSNAVIADAFVVRSVPLSENIVVAGSIMPSEATDIRPEISGRLVSIHLREGAFVKKGTLLAKLFDGDLQAQLKKLEVQLAINEKTVERYRELL